MINKNASAATASAATVSGAGILAQQWRQRGSQTMGQRRPPHTHFA
jgi:hypothetical protein